MVFVGNPVAKINQTKTRQVSYLTIEVGNSDSIGESLFCFVFGLIPPALVDFYKFMAFSTIFVCFRHSLTILEHFSKIFCQIADFSYQIWNICHFSAILGIKMFFVVFKINQTKTILL